jgi:hypothetical protein
MSGSCSIRRRRAIIRLAGCPVVAIVISCSVLSGSHAGAQGFCFSAAVNYAAGDGPYSVFAVDLDGDGDQDLAVANISSSNVSVLKNNGDGTFAAAVHYPVGVSPRSVFASDLDGDDDADLAVANLNSDNISVLKNNGDGTFFAVAVNYPAGDGPVSVFAADLDGDYDADLAVANYWSKNVSVLKNNGNGVFAAAVNYAAGDYPTSVSVADLDGDNDADLAVANEVGDNVSVLKNNGNGTFAAAVNYAAGDAPLSVFAADLDGDQYTDLAVANYSSSNTVSVLKNNGDGSFAAAVNYAAGSFPAAVFADDLDGDGDQDLAAVNNGNNNVSVLRNNGDGTFATPVNYAAGNSPFSVFAADLDGDGDQDLAVANQPSDSVSVLKNCLLPIVVSSLSNSGLGSLRSAIETANTHIGPDTIAFSVAGTISLLSPLAAILDAIGGTVILGFTAPGASSPMLPSVVLDGSSSMPGPGLELASPDNRVEGLTFRNFAGPGIAVTGALSLGNTVTACRFYGNAGPGIDLGDDGITPNDPTDADTGPNTLLNYPFFDSILEVGLDTFAVYGRATVSSRVELFLAAEAGNPGRQPEPTIHGPAYTLLGSTVAAGDGSFSFLGIAMPEWSLVTATATDPAGNTSELALNKTLTPDPLRITAYSELVAPARGVLAMPLTSPTMQIVVISPPNALGKRDTIGPPPMWPNTFGPRATYDSLTDHNSGGIVDTRVKIVSPDSGEYQIKYILIGDPGNYLTGIGIDGHAEVKKQIAFASVGQVVDTTYHLAPPARGELNGDGVIDVFDVVASIDMVFSGAPMPDPPELVDVNCDGVPDVFDVVYLIDYAFSGGLAPCQ